MSSHLAVTAAAAVLLVLAAAGRVEAQPGAAPINEAPGPAPVTMEGDKSPGTALALSLGGTVASLALASLGGGETSTDDDVNGLMATTGTVGLWLAPSFGHWYAGEGWTTGLSWRLGGAAAVGAGAIWVVLSCTSGHDLGGNGSGDDCQTGGVLLAGAGAAAFLGGVVYDIATAPGAARRANERRRAAAQNLMVSPSLGRDHVGFAVGGRF